MLVPPLLIFQKVVAEFDSVSHSGAVLESHPSIRLADPFSIHEAGVSPQRQGDRLKPITQFQRPRGVKNCSLPRPEISSS